jgi:hypothetical protein
MIENLPVWKDKLIFGVVTPEPWRNTAAAQKKEEVIAYLPPIAASGALCNGNPNEFAAVDRSLAQDSLL